MLSAYFTFKYLLRLINVSAQNRQRKQKQKSGNTNSDRHLKSIPFIGTYFLPDRYDLPLRLKCQFKWRLILLIKYLSSDDNR